jgi:flavin-dependent dehydrogenase
MMIPATLRLEEAAERLWDVVVVGAGPAGALAAHELARRRMAVLLVDQAAFPRWKVCGCCLNRQALATLEAVGLGQLTQRLGAVPLDDLLLASRGRQARLRLTGGVVLSREAFDVGLVTAAVEQGAAFLPSTRAVLAPAGHHWRPRVVLYQVDQTVELATRLVLAADGLGGRFVFGAGKHEAASENGSWIGAGAVACDAPAFFAPHTIFMACGTGGYVGLVRLEDGRLSIAAAFDPRKVKQMRHPAEATAAILREAEFPPVPELRRLSWRGTPPLTRRAPRLALDRLFVLGDAAGYVQPFTGEGMAWALAAGKAISPLALRGARSWQPGLKKEWACLYHHTVSRRQGTCRLLMRMLRHPSLTSMVIGILARLPLLAQHFLRRVHQGSPSPRRALA